VTGLFERPGDHERDRLALMVDPIVLQHVQALADNGVRQALVLAIGEPRRIAVCQNSQNAGRPFSLGRVD
jgi:hypothetical protein